MDEEISENEIEVCAARKEDMVAVYEMIQYRKRQHKTNKEDGRCIPISKPQTFGIFNYESDQELADFEKMPEGPKISASVLQRDGFESSPAAFSCMVARACSGGGAGTRVLGYAIYFPTYSTWEGRALMLEDLYVRPQHRRRNIGERLFRAVAQEAVKMGCARMDFHVLEWNPARAFYEARGAVDLTGAEHWRCYRLSGDALRDQARSHTFNDTQ